MDLVDLIFAARRTGDALANTLPSLTLDEGYAVQRALAERTGPVLGWKVGATSARARSVLGVTEPIYGRVFAPPAAGTIVAGPRPLELEPEIIVELGAELAPARAWVGLEIVRPSRDDALALGAPFIVADNAAHVALVLGTELPLANVDAARVRLLLNGTPASEGAATAVEGGPLASLAWLARTLAHTAHPLRPGDLVATGAMARAVKAGPGDTVVADFGEHGRAEVRIS